VALIFARARPTFQHLFGWVANEFLKVAGFRNSEGIFEAPGFVKRP